MKLHKQTTILNFQRDNDNEIFIIGGTVTCIMPSYKEMCIDNSTTDRLFQHIIFENKLRLKLK